MRTKCAQGLIEFIVEEAGTDKTQEACDNSSPVCFTIAPSGSQANPQRVLSSQCPSPCSPHRCDVSSFPTVLAVPNVSSSF